MLFLERSLSFHRRRKVDGRAQEGRETIHGGAKCDSILRRKETSVELRLL